MPRNNKRREIDWTSNYSDVYCIEWPPHLRRSVAITKEDSNLNVTAGGEKHDATVFANKTAVDVSRPHVSVPFALDTANPGEHFIEPPPRDISEYSNISSPNEIVSKEYYDTERAREMHYLRNAGTLTRRLTPCCSAFYYNMVVLGLKPPFEGLYPCKTHEDYYTKWRESILKTAAKRAAKNNRLPKPPGQAPPCMVDESKSILRRMWEPEYHVYSGNGQHSIGTPAAFGGRQPTNYTWN